MIATKTNPGATINQVTVTPAQARKLLESNSRNRTIRRQIIDKYRRDMLTGNWAYTADPIRFSASGVLLDGQHRLTAIASINDDAFSVPMLIVTGLPDESQMYMDQGRSRSAGQQLGLVGVKNAYNIAAGARLYMLWQSGLMFQDNGKQQSLTNVRIQEWVADNSDLAEFEAQVHTDLRGIKAPPSVTIAAMFAFAQIDRAATIEFFDKVRRGVNLGDFDPILLLRNKLDTIQSRKYRVEPRVMLWYFVKTWNLWREGSARKSLAAPTSAQLTADSFPVAQ